METAQVKNSYRNQNQTHWIMEVIKNTVHAITLWSIRSYGNNIKAMEKYSKEEKGSIAIYRSLQHQ